MALPATDVFTAADGTALTTYSASWTYNFGAFSIVVNRVRCDVGAGGEGGARWNADTWPNDHYSFGTFVSMGGAGIGVAVRVQTGTAGDYYGYYAESGARKMFTMIAGSWTQKGSAGGQPSDGAVLRLEAVGTTITAKIDGATDTAVGTSGAFTDSSFASGAAGLSGWGAGSASGLDNWEGGSLAAAGITRAPAVGPVVLTGIAPSLAWALRPAEEVLALSGIAPNVAEGLFLLTPAGALILGGSTPTLSEAGVLVNTARIHIRPVGFV